MSVRVMTAVWGVDLPPAEKLLLLALADVANEFGDSIYPSVATMSAKTSMPERTVQRHLASLRESGILVEVEAAGWNRPTRYRINLAGLNELPQSMIPGPRKCPPALRTAVIEAFASTCQYCQRQGDGDIDPDGRPFHVDRIIPGARGGNYAPENVTLSCARCNSVKRDRDPMVEVETLAERGANLAPIERGAISRTQGVPDQAPRGAILRTQGVPPHAPDPSVDPPEDPLRDLDRRGKTSVELSSAQRETLDYLHQSVMVHVFGGSDAPPTGWCEDLIRRGATRNDCDHAVQAAVTRQARSLQYVRTVLEGRTREREQGRDPDARQGMGGGIPAGSGDHRGPGRNGGVRAGDPGDARTSTRQRDRRGQELPDLAAVARRQAAQRAAATHPGGTPPVAGAQPSLGLPG